MTLLWNTLLPLQHELGPFRKHIYVSEFSMTKICTLNLCFMSFVVDILRHWWSCLFTLFCNGHKC